MVGLGYRLLPLFTGVELWRPSWMRAFFWLLAVGNTTRVTRELATGARWTYLVMGSSGVMELAAITLFGISIWKTFGGRRRAPAKRAAPGSSAAHSRRSRSTHIHEHCQPRSTLTLYSWPYLLP